MRTHTPHRNISRARTYSDSGGMSILFLAVCTRILFHVPQYIKIRVKATEKIWRPGNLLHMEEEWTVGCAPLRKPMLHPIYSPCCFCLGFPLSFRMLVPLFSTERFTEWLVSLEGFTLIIRANCKLVRRDYLTMFPLTPYKRSWEQVITSVHTLNISFLPTFFFCFTLLNFHYGPAIRFIRRFMVE